MLREHAGEPSMQALPAALSVAPAVPGILMAADQDEVVGPRPT